jgi:hypothetical protein
VVALAAIFVTLPAFCVDARAEGSAPKGSGSVHVSSAPATGSTEVAAPSVASAGETSPKAGISVHVVEGARVLVDGAEAGRAEPGRPFDLTLPPGDYSVRVLYDGGSNEKRKVLVTEGHVTSLEFRELPGSRLLFEKRDRWLMGFSAGGGVFAPDLRGSLGPQFEAGLLLARALSKAVEFRTLIGLHGWVADTRGLQVLPEGQSRGGDQVNGLGLAVTVEPGFVFHLGSVYTMGVSVAGRLGVGIPLSNEADFGELTTTTSSFLVGVAPRASPLGFAFGENREHHIELVGGAVVSTVRGFGLDMGELRYSLLFF